MRFGLSEFSIFVVLFLKLCTGPGDSAEHRKELLVYNLDTLCVTYGTLCVKYGSFHSFELRRHYYPSMAILPNMVRCIVSSSVRTAPPELTEKALCGHPRQLYSHYNLDFP